MTLNEFLDYKLIDTEQFDFSVYSLLIILTILISTIIGLKVIKSIFRGRVKRGKLDKGSSNSIFLIVKYIVWVIVIILALDSVGVKVSILIASAAALLVGVGLGLQQLFNDLASGLILLIERDLKVDDVLQLHDGLVGKVVKIGLRTSQIKTRDDIIIVIPNSKFVNDNIINWSHSKQSTRFNIVVGVSYNSDTILVKDTLLKCANNHKNVSDNPAPFVRFNNFGDSALEFQLFFWTTETFRVENIKSEIRFKITEEFRKNNIQIPFPQRDLHLISKKFE